MDCPRDRSPLKVTDHEGSEVDKCGTCGGIWLDRGELEAIQDKLDHEHAKQAAHQETNAAARAENEVVQLTTAPVDCPKCGERMVARDYGLGAQIVIDACPKDCGIWLDVGELQQIERFYQDSRKDAIDVLPFGLWIRLKLSDLKAKLS